MLKTHGLTHISLAVRDLDRTLRFYTQVFGVREYFRDETSIQVPSISRSPKSNARAVPFFDEANSLRGIRSYTWKIRMATKSRSGTSSSRRHVPEGWPTVIPRIVAHGAAGLVEFLRR